MENPFESGHIKNYLLLYASVVVIMILFFIASTLFHERKEVEQKKFYTEVKDKNVSNVKVKKEVVKTLDENTSANYRLIKIPH